MKLTLEIPEGLMRIIDDMAKVMGLTREEAAISFLRNDAGGWYAKVMKRK